MRPISRICNFKGENVVIGIVAFFAGIIATLIFFSASGHEWSTRFQRDAWTTLGYYKRGSTLSFEELSTVHIYAITPTYARPTQRVDLISLCHTLMHVPNITWIVVEDSVNKTQPVRDVLTKQWQCKSVASIHLATRSPKPLAKGRGINQRNAGLSWIRQKCGSQSATEKKCNGVVYLMDDDNKYDLRLFHEIRKTKKVSVFPVAFAGGLLFEGPICAKNGRAASWHVVWAPERPVPIDMAGFAINVDLIVRNEDAVLGQMSNGTKCSMLETCFLEQFTTRETAECIGGKEIMAWHVKTQGGYYNEKKNPSDKSYAF